MGTPLSFGLVANTLQEHRWFFNCKGTSEDWHTTHHYARSLKWFFYFYDDDPFPSIPHGHSEDNRFVLNVDTGEVIERATGTIKGKATKKELKDLKNSKGYRELEQKSMEYHKNKKTK